MKTKKKIYIAASALAVLVTAAGAGVIHAASLPGSNGQDKMTNLATLIAQKFNLNVTDVQKVFEEQRAQMEAEHQKQFTDRINQAVTDGKLTQDQANKIIAKQTEIKYLMNSLKNKTEAEREAAMKTQMESLKAWVEENNIPKEFALFGGPRMGHGFGHGKGSGMMRKGGEMKPITTETTAK